MCRCEIKIMAVTQYNNRDFTLPKVFSHVEHILSGFHPNHILNEPKLKISILILLFARTILIDYPIYNNISLNYFRAVCNLYSGIWFVSYCVNTDLKGDRLKITLTSTFPKSFVFSCIFSRVVKTTR